MKEAILYEQLAHRSVRCHLCVRQCQIRPGERGHCRTRENQQGRLMTLIYDRVSSAALDPIEKKPLYHFHPGTSVYSLGTLGCSFTCPGCQNWQISQRSPLVDDPQLLRMTPEDAIAEALRYNAAGICWTYNEPAIWLEHTLEGARLAKDQGLYTAFVTNGTATREQLDLLGPSLDAYRVDIKAFSRPGYKAIAGYGDYEQILVNVQYAYERWGMHIECVTNITPTINDSDEELHGIAQWIASVLGVDTPWHVTRFYPYEGFMHLPVTPMERIDRAVEIGTAAGLRYIYVGNVAGDARQQTLCPSCGNTIIHRQGFAVTDVHLHGGACPNCGTAIAGRWS